MERISNVDSLEHGISFMNWIFSGGQRCADDVRNFVLEVGLNWDEIKELCSDSGVIKFIKKLEQCFKQSECRTFEWFEVGRNMILVSNMAATGAPQDILEKAIAGYRLYLEEANIRVGERNKLENLIRQLANGSIKDKEKLLTQIRERLRDQAIRLNEKDSPTVETTATNPWVSGSFYLFSVIAIGASLLIIAIQLPLLYIPPVLIGALLATSLVGILQLMNDRRMKEKTFVELMKLYFNGLPLLKFLKKRNS